MRPVDFKDEFYSRNPLSSNNDIHVVGKCDCDKHIACIVCGEEKGLDGDFWKRIKEQ